MKLQKKIAGMRPSPAMIVACLALFVAIGGVGVAAVKLKKNSVKTKTIKDKAVTGPKIASGAVGADQLADNAVTTPKIADGSVGKTKVSATGTATNTGTFGLTSGQCSQISAINAPGIKPGDIVAVSFGEINPGALSASLGDGTTSTADKLVMTICDQGANITVNPGDLDFTWVAFR